MKTAVIVSDSHGNRAVFDKLAPVFKESDYIFHLGDHCADGLALKKIYGDKVFIINGNCDIYALGENELITEIEGVKIFACHGHLYSVKSGYDKLLYKAEELGCDIALFGHTHVATVLEYGSTTLINPGNLSRYSQNSYCYLVIHNGKPVAKIVNI
ncbi:MAG: metallophosphoesterase [Clostridia bacterium]|nr:metallophosphoesterase [Clostridia bacterium]